VKGVWSVSERPPFEFEQSSRIGRRVRNFVWKGVTNLSPSRRKRSGARLQRPAPGTFRRDGVGDLDANEDNTQSLSIDYRQEREGPWTQEGTGRKLQRERNFLRPGERDKSKGKRKDEDVYHCVLAYWVPHDGETWVTRGIKEGQERCLNYNPRGEIHNNSTKKKCEEE